MLILGLNIVVKRVVNVEILFIVFVFCIYDIVKSIFINNSLWGILFRLIDISYRYYLVSL